MTAGRHPAAGWPVTFSIRRAYKDQGFAPSVMTNTVRRLPALLALLSGLKAAAATSTAAPTFAEDIAPIIFEHCAGCHRPGEAAPFSLLDFADVKRRGRQISEVTSDRLMPPWKVEASDFSFRDDRRLSGEQIQLIRDWVATGMPEGNSAKTPALPMFPDKWLLGEPDLIVKMDQSFPVPAEGRDIYRNFVLPLDLPDEKWVRAVDFRPGAKSVVHHSLFFFDTTGAARELDAQDVLPGYGNRMNFGRRGGGRFDASFAGDNPEDAQFGSLGGWAVGGNARELPAGLAMRLPKGADLILSTHFHPSGRAEDELSTVALYFADEPPAEHHTGIQLPPLFGALEGIDIPAGESEYVVEDGFKLPVGVRAFGLGAHAHYLGKSMKLTATLPDGTVKTLAWIKDWDFAWQEQYLFADFVELPAETILDVRITYDNSADNPRNPSQPPRRVKWGEQSTDEMGSMTLLVVPVVANELTRLKIAYRAHIREGVAERMRSRWSQRGDPGQRGTADLDKNGDGQITRDELPARQRAMFDRLDANQNGVLDEAELRELQKLFRAGELGQ